MSPDAATRRQGTILDAIMAYHRQELPKRKRQVPLADLRALASVAAEPVDFAGALRAPGVSLIAECKKASPSKGLLAKSYDPVALAIAYARAGAKAISVLTESRHFQGSLADLRNVKEALAELRLPAGRRANLPVLRKDFIFDPYQVFEARAAGADALLLIAAVLTDSDLEALLALTHKLGMQALVEVHTAAEVARVLPLGVQVLGVNNRNLHTFEVDFDNTARLRALIPQAVVLVGESGIRTAADVRRMRDIGVDAILVGETLVKSKDVQQEARRLVLAGQIAPA